MRNLVFFEKQRTGLINSKVAYLLEDKENRDENFYPFEKNNFAEYLSNLLDDDFEKLRTGAEASFKGGIDAPTFTGMALSKGALAYWKERAVNVAEAETMSVEQLEKEGYIWAKGEISAGGKITEKGKIK
jgi:hypothetical protein